MQAAGSLGLEVPAVSVSLVPGASMIAFVRERGPQHGFVDMPLLGLHA